MSKDYSIIRHGFDKETRLHYTAFRPLGRGKSFAEVLKAFNREMEGGAGYRLTKSEHGYQIASRPAGRSQYDWQPTDYRIQL